MTLNNEIMIRIDTPKDDDPCNLSTRATSRTENAVELRAQLSLKQVLEDSQEIDAYLKNTVGSSGVNQKS